MILYLFDADVKEKVALRESAGRHKPDPMMLADMQAMERAVALNLKAFVQAYTETVPQVGAAWAECAGGVAAFTGRGSPLTTVKGSGPEVAEQDLEQVEDFYRGRGAGAVRLEVAPWLSEDSRELLRRRGYKTAGTEDVVALAAPKATAETPVVEMPPEAWPEVMRLGYELSDESPWREMVRAAAGLPGARLLGLRDDAGEWIACAQMVGYGRVIILGCDGTIPAARGRGAQTALIRARLGMVSSGSLVMAEVAPGSGSERNYLRCGFRIAYSRTHCVKQFGGR